MDETYLYRMLSEEWKKIEELENSLREYQDMVDTERQLQERLEEENAKQSNTINSCQSRLHRLEVEKNQYENHLKVSSKHLEILPIGNSGVS